VIAVSVGPKASAETLRTALAMGADRGIHILTDIRTDQELGSLSVAKILAKVASEESPDAIILGKQSIDGDFGCTGSMLASLMDVPQCTFAAKIDFDASTVERETDTGTEIVKFPGLPAVFTADLRLNEPRYATLPNIMKAKKKKIDTKSIEDLGVELSEGNEVLEVFEPPPREAGILVDDVDGLVDKLKNEASVI
jgi:electron transfer flavoprotein beta subunit